MFEHDIRKALARMFPPPKYAHFYEVRVPPGWKLVGGAKRRIADAIVVGRWPSSGLAVHGFEFKLFKGDWAQELSRPEKAGAIKQFCDYWWLVIGDERVACEKSVPKDWGFLGPRASTNTLRTIRDAPRLSGLGAGREFLCSLLNQALEGAVKASALSPVGCMICEGCNRERRCYDVEGKKICIACRR